MSSQQKGPCRAGIDQRTDDCRGDAVDDAENRALIENDMEDVEVMPWLQEAIQTINVLEARLVELEEDCKSIPLYEQDRAEMIKVIQDFDSVVKQDQAWIDDTEKAVRWTIFALEEALLPSNRPEGLRRSSKSGVSSLEKEDNPVGRKSCSEGILPSLTGSTLASSEGMVARNSMDEQGGIVQLDRSNENQNMETVYRNAIQTALRHLRTIEHSHSTNDRQTSRSVGNGNDDKVLDRLNRRKSSVPPTEALKEWLENASIMSRISSKTVDVGGDIDDDDDFYDHLDDDYNDDYDEYDEEKEQAIMDMYCDSKIEQDDEASRDHQVVDNNPQGNESEAASASKARNRRISIQSVHSIRSIQSQRRRRTSKILQDHSASSTSFQATLSGSTQSMKTDLDGCFVDERVYLKQHIQTLDKLRAQELERHQKAEKAHQQLIEDMMKFSKELLQGVNELTCAQAALGDASEITLMTLKNSETGSTGSVHSEGASTDSSKRKRMVASSCKGMADSVTMVEEGIKRIKTLAADCVDIAELAQSQREDAQEMASNNLEAPSPSAVSPLSPTMDGVESSHTQAPFIAKPLSIQTSDLHDNQPGLSTPIMSIPSTPLTFKAMLSPQDQKALSPSSVFVDGVAFQEFEAHMASLRSGVDSLSKKIQRRISISPRKSLMPLSAAPPSSLTSVEPDLYLKRVLAEDIYPCLLIPPGNTTTRQSSWMSSFLSSSSTSLSMTASTYGTNPSSLWRQQLLKALENNACEIGSWKMASSGLASANATPTTLKPTTAGMDNAATAPTSSCSLCGLSRPCEFRLRVADQDGNKTTQTEPKWSQYYPLDRFCRDRIVAVCDFYTFLAHLRQGLLDHQSNLELFRRALWLRQRMGCARIGSMGIVQASPDVTHRRTITASPSLATVLE